MATVLQLVLGYGPREGTRAMRRSNRPWLALLLLLGAQAPARCAEVSVAQAGKALLPIVIAPKASVGTQKVAAELAGYLGRIAGARFEVRRGDGTSGIVLGTLSEFPCPDLAEPLQIRGRFDGREAYAI